MKFRYSPYDEDIVIVGGKSKGKTFKAKWILSQISRLPYLIYDYNNLFSNFGSIIHNVNEIRYDQIIYQGDKTLAGFISVCDKLFAEAQKGILSDMVFVVDELHQYYRNKQTVIQSFEQIVMTARNYGVSGIYISTRPATIPNNVLSNASHCFAFGLSNFNDIVWLKDYIGEKAWLLIPRDKRKKLQSEKELTKHSCIYRNQNEPESQMMICNCAECNNQKKNFPEVYF